MRLKHFTDKELAEWNTKNPIGSKCTLTYGGRDRHTVTRSAAWKLPNDYSVVLLEGITGAYAVDFLKMEEVKA